VKDFESLTQLLNRALSSELGLEVESDDPDSLRRRLYVVIRRHREEGTGDFSGLTIRQTAVDRIRVLNEKGAANDASERGGAS
jgi:hypothetical protein